MGTNKISILLIISLTIFSCKTNKYLHRDIKNQNYQIISKCINNQINDSTYIDNNTICIKESLDRIRIGDVLEKRAKGKWYYYYIVNDTIECYAITKIVKKDTLNIHSEFWNKNNW